jgi:ABC-type amino acid transport system permease subunit
LSGRFKSIFFFELAKKEKIFKNKTSKNFAALNFAALNFAALNFAALNFAALRDKMDINCIFLLKMSWPIFWITTAYSYFLCAIIGVITGIKTKGNKEEINKKIENFIISPFYTSTFFCLLAVLYFWRGMGIFQHVKHFPAIHMLVMGLMVFAGHIGIEIIESILFKKNPMRILEDKDAIHLCGIYLLVLFETLIMSLLIL